MIITKNVEMKLGIRNATRIISMYDLDSNLKPGDTALIPVNLLSKSSNYKIKVSCDYCGLELYVPYKRYNKSTSTISKYSCSSKQCSNQKIKEVCQAKYGVDNPFQSDVIKDKIKKTLNEKYGKDHPMYVDKIKSKIKDTCLKRYGVSSYTKTKEYKEKTIKTNLEKYGVNWPLQSEEVKNKGIKTSLEKYGVKYSQQSYLIRQKTIRTNLEKYGVKCNLQSDDSKAKIKKTILEKYGVDNIMDNDEFREKFNITKDNSYVSYLSDKMSRFKCEKGHYFEISSDNYISRRKNNVDLRIVCNSIGDSKSLKEEELYNFIKSIYNGKVEQSYRDGLEIDIYLPTLNIGFEFNGLYWHSESYKGKDYHLDKTEHFKNRGIKIIHIWEDDWVFNKNIIKSQINNWIGLTSKKIYGRKCLVREISDSKVVTKFLDENHIQGKVRSSLKLGLYHMDELVSVMTFSHNEGRKNMPNSEWNLSRFCNKLDTSVIGGASKLLKYFQRSFKPTRIISYADKDWSTGDLYYNLGFKLSNISRPDYKYIINNRRVHKSRFRKNNLNTELSESQYMKKSHILKIWDCGKIKFEI